MLDTHISCYFMANLKRGSLSDLVGKSKTGKFDYGLPHTPNCQIAQRVACNCSKGKKQINVIRYNCYNYRLVRQRV